MTTIPLGYADCSLQIRHSALARPSFLTFGVQCSGVAADAVAEEVFQAICVESSTFNVIFANEVTLGPVTARVGQDAAEAISVVSSSTPLTGGSAIEKLSANNAVLVHKRTARGGRRGRGRWFIPWFGADADVSEVGIISVGATPPMNTALAGILTRLAANNVPMVLLHSESEPGVEHPTTPGTPNAVTSMVVDPLIGTQRRRLGR
jgi:hypothetical protein